MSIRVRLTIMFLVFVLIPSLFVGVLTFTNYKNSLETLRLSALQDIAAFKADKIEIYFAGLKANIEIAQGYYNIKKNLPVLNRLTHTTDLEFLSARKLLDEQLQRMQSVLLLSDIMLVNPMGEIVYSSNPEQNPKDFLDRLPDPEQKAFAEGKDKVYFSDIFFDKAKGNVPVMLVTAPATGFEGAFIGVIAFEVDMSNIYKLIQDVTGLGKTGEVLLGKKTGDEVVYLNPLRHDPEAVLKRSISIGGEHGGPVQKAVQGRKGAGHLIDYRGKKVIAAWRYIPSLDWGMVAKIDAEEAFAEVINLRNLVMIILTIVFSLCGIIAFSIAKSISEPIKNLSRGAEIVGSGNLDYKVETNLNDEIGQLSRTFDKMTRDLKRITASRDELNKEIAERKRAEELLSENEGRLKRSQEIAHLGGWELDLHNNMLTWSDEVYRIFGLQPQEFGASYEAFLEAVHPDDRSAVDAAYSGSLRDGRDTYEIDHRVVRKSTGEIRYVHEKCQHVRDETGRVIRSVGMVHDITERKRAEEDLQKALSELERSNRELEQFAYVASHDLQEPLRMVASYVKLLEKKYRGQLDEKADQYIHFAVDGALRMQKLIEGLLAYARIGRGGEFTLVNTDNIVSQVVSDLAESLQESRAVITKDDLPTVSGDETLFMQLFQNLIRNAVKFRKPEVTPQVHVSAKKEGREWIFSVRDNGVGIDQAYANRIFLIFQRLHTREEYPGTGIGLALCKKIVERHHGRIWVESVPDEGATFFFAIPG